MKRYFNERTLQVLLCLLLFAVGFVTWRFTRSALLCMLACVGFTVAWIAIGFWSTHLKNRQKA